MARKAELNINQLDPKYMALGSKLNDLVDNPFYGLVNNGVLASSKVARSQLLRPFPQFTTINPLFSSGASSTYHSLQVSANKRLSHGLQFQAAFTWAKDLDNGQTYQDSFNVNGEWALADIDIARRLVASFVYELPFGRGRHFGKNAPGGSELGARRLAVQRDHHSPNRHAAGDFGKQHHRHIHRNDPR